MSDEGPVRYHVTFELAEGDRSIVVRADEFTLAAARRAGLVMPSLCE